jgi:transcriptional antiterminator Rof (Rho-off)
MDRTKLIQEYIELKEEEKVRKKRLDEINKFFKNVKKQMDIKDILE